MKTMKTGIGTWAEGQYSTDSGKATILRWLGEVFNGDHEAVARYMKDSLRVGGIRVCRKLVAGGVESANGLGTKGV